MKFAALERLGADYADFLTRGEYEFSTFEEGFFLMDDEDFFVFFDVDSDFWNNKPD